MPLSYDSKRTIELKITALLTILVWIALAAIWWQSSSSRRKYAGELPRSRLAGELMAYGQTGVAQNSENTPPDTPVESRGGISLSPPVKAVGHLSASLTQRSSSDFRPDSLQKSASGKLRLPQPGHYTIQVGAFKQEDGAGRLLDQLTQKGYRPYLLQSSPRNGEQFFRLWVGDFGSLVEAYPLRSRLRRDAFDTYIRRVD